MMPSALRLSASTRRFFCGAAAAIATRTTSADPDSLIARYTSVVSERGLEADGGQVAVIERLEALRQALMATSSSSPPRSVYLHGGVGIGKTFLMDLLHDAALSSSRRVHFHSFMLETHQRMHRLRQSGQSQAGDPLRVVGAALASEQALLCFDEFQVTDIADAVILKRLFEVILTSDCSVVLTSNRPPEDLYENGLNRHLFIPFIDFVRDRFDVLDVDALREQEKQQRTHHHRAAFVEDYRQLADRGPPVQGMYSWPLGPQATGELQRAMQRHARGDAVSLEGAGVVEGKMAATVSAAGPEAEVLPTAVELRDQDIDVMMNRRLRVPLVISSSSSTSDCGWRDACCFSFESLCGTSIGAADYLAIVKRFSLLAITDVPKLTPELKEQALRFIILIDTLYESQTLLALACDVPPDELFALYAYNNSTSSGDDGKAGTAAEAADAAAAAAASVVGEGGSSGRSTTMIGNVEWSATGLVGRSLADLTLGTKDETRFAAGRAASRLTEMRGADWVNRALVARSRSIF